MMKNLSKEMIEIRPGMLKVVERKCGEIAEGHIESIKDWMEDRKADGFSDFYYCNSKTTDEDLNILVNG
jgi:hypothetical protein